MGMYDTVLVPCPTCGEKYPAQTKGGPCYLTEYELERAPSDVLSDVNRHAPFTCDACGAVFTVRLRTVGTPMLCGGQPEAAGFGRGDVVYMTQDVDRCDLKAGERGVVIDRLDDADADPTYYVEVEDGGDGETRIVQLRGSELRRDY